MGTTDATATLIEIVIPRAATCQALLHEPASVTLETPSVAVRVQVRSVPAAATEPFPATQSRRQQIEAARKRHPPIRPERSNA